MDAKPDRLVAGRYRLLSPLGSGGMGTVWRAADEVLGREVAVKEITFPHGLSDADRDVLRERTRREARAAARLDHPSAVTVYDVVEHDGAPHLVMELVEARTLAEVVREDGPLSPQATAEVGLALLGALGTAHAQGIVHRDVKPSNVLVRDDGRVVLTDFGIATTTGDSSITHTGLLLGSPAYIAPERARGEAPGPASDLWSLGATLFTAVEGTPPFDGGEPLLTVTAVVTGEHAPYAAAGPLAPVLDGLLEKDPTRRLELGRTRAMLQRVADSGPAASARAVTAAAPMAGAARTTALSIGAVHDEVAAVERNAPSPTSRLPAAAPLPTAPATRVARPVPAADPDRARRRPGWLVPAALAGAAAVAIGVGALALSVGRDTGGASAAASSPAGPATEPTPARRASAAPSRVQPPATPPAGGIAGVPADWSTDTGPAGWTVALPPGYTSAGGGEYRQAGTGRTLRVDSGPGQPDAVKDREQQAKSFEKRHPTYEEISISAVDYRGYEAADWEFTYEGLHVVNRVFVVDGTGYSLYFQTRAGDFAGARSDFDGIARAFRPAGA